MKLQIKTNEKTGENLYYTTHKSGLKIYIMPKKDYTSTYAVFGTKYGSVGVYYPCARRHCTFS